MIAAGLLGLVMVGVKSAPSFRFDLHGIEFTETDRDVVELLLYLGALIFNMMKELVNAFLFECFYNEVVFC